MSKLVKLEDIEGIDGEELEFITQETRLPRVEIAEVVHAHKLWLANNPKVPTNAQLEEICNAYSNSSSFMGFACVEWQRQMFLKEEETLPAEVKALLYDSVVATVAATPASYNKKILEAYNLGKAEPK